MARINKRIENKIKETYNSEKWITMKAKSDLVKKKALNEQVLQGRKKERNYEKKDSNNSLKHIKIFFTNLYSPFFFLVNI